MEVIRLLEKTQMGSMEVQLLSWVLTLHSASKGEIVGQQRAVVRDGSGIIYQ